MRELEGVALEREVAERVLEARVIDPIDDWPEYPFFRCTREGLYLHLAQNAYDIWSPLRSMQDACEVSDRLHDLGYQLDLGNFRPGDAPESHNWHAKFANGKCTASMGYGMTAGEAICRSALSAVEGNPT